MRIHIDSSIRGEERTVTVTLRGTDADFIGLIDQGDALPGELGNLMAEIAKMTGLVDVRIDDRAHAARLMRRAAEVLERVVQ